MVWYTYNKTNITKRPGLITKDPGDIDPGDIDPGNICFILLTFHFLSFLVQRNKSTFSPLIRELNHHVIITIKIIKNT